MFKTNKRRYDVMNVVSIVDKFLQDSLVQAEKIEDDNYTVVPSITGIHGGIEKDRGRIEVSIKEM